jgi:hypothetical protein
MRKLQWTAIVGGVVAIVLASYVGGDLFAGKRDDPKSESKPTSDQPGDNASAPAAATPSSGLPLTRVVLFNSGVGYFERQGEIDGDVRVDLAFSVQDVNDVIKSMVVQDLDGGKVSSISFDSLAPMEKALNSFAVDLSDNPTYAEILDRSRGERIEIILQQSNTSQPGTITGTIVGVETKMLAQPNCTAVNVEHVNLLCAEGMRSVKLTDIQRVRFLNPMLESELKKALEIVSQGHDNQKKTVSLVCLGKGKRRVRVGYVAENPIWKTSYRLVLDGDKPPFLQGWAVVENNTDEDWHKVAMNLISGRPISFQMDLYEPLYVSRPVVEPEQFASLRPATYGGIVKADASARLANRELRRGALHPSAAAQFGTNLGTQFGINTGNQFGGIQLGGQLGLQLGGQPGAGNGSGDGVPRGPTMNLQDGVSSVANATKNGDFFQYQIDHAVSLARQKSAMLPIVNTAIVGARVSVYNEKVQARFALLGLRFKNKTELHLNHGPVTIFDADSYAGDAHIPDMHPGEVRILTYAVDLGTRVTPQDDGSNGKRTSVTIIKGIVHTKSKFRKSKTYTITNRSAQDRLVLIEHPFDSAFLLTAETEKPMETTRDVYRFKQIVEKGATAKLVVTEERDDGETYTISNSESSLIQLLINEPVASKDVKEALQTALAKKWELARTTTDIQSNQREVAKIYAEQPRLRDNLRTIPLTDPLAKRILEKLNQQETELEKYLVEFTKLNAKADQQRQDYDTFLAGLNLK